MMITAISVFILFIAVQFICGAATLLFSNIDKLGSGLPLNQLSIQPVTLGITMLIGEGLLAFGLWWWFNKVEKPVRLRSAANPELGSIFKFKPVKRELVARHISRQYMVYGIVATLLLAIGVSGIVEHFGFSDDGTTNMFLQMKGNPLCWLLMCIVGPLAEELTFRVGILRSLYRLKVAGWLSAFITALLFGLVHGNLAQGSAALIIGFALGLMYLRTGDLRLCLPAHIINNTLAMLLACLPNVPEAGMCLSIISILAGALLLAYSLRPYSAETVTTTHPNTTNQEQ